MKTLDRYYEDIKEVTTTIIKFITMSLVLQDTSISHSFSKGLHVISWIHVRNFCGFWSYNCGFGFFFLATSTTKWMHVIFVGFGLVKMGFFLSNSICFVKNRCESSTNNEKKSNPESWQTDHWNGDEKWWSYLYGKGL